MKAKTIEPDKPKQPKLTLKQEAACQAYIESFGNQSKAYRRAYNAENMSPEAVWVEASKLFSKPMVALRILDLQAKHKERHNITIDSITDNLDAARDIARESGQAAAMVAATMSKAKLHGLIPNNREIITKRKQPLAWKVTVVDPDNANKEKMASIK